MEIVATLASLYLKAYEFLDQLARNTFHQVCVYLSGK